MREKDSKEISRRTVIQGAGSFALQNSVPSFKGRENVGRVLRTTAPFIDATETRVKDASLNDEVALTDPSGMIAFVDRFLDSRDVLPSQALGGRIFREDQLFLGATRIDLIRATDPGLSEALHFTVYPHGMIERGIDYSFYTNKNTSSEDAFFISYLKDKYDALDRGDQAVITSALEQSGLAAINDTTRKVLIQGLLEGVKKDPDPHFFNTTLKTGLGLDEIEEVARESTSQFILSRIEEQLSQLGAGTRRETVNNAFPENERITMSTTLPLGQQRLYIEHESFDYNGLHTQSQVRLHYVTSEEHGLDQVFTLDMFRNPIREVTPPANVLLEEADSYSAAIRKLKVASADHGLILRMFEDAVEEYNTGIPFNLKDDILRQQIEPPLLQKLNAEFASLHQGSDVDRGIQELIEKAKLIDQFPSYFSLKHLSSTFSLTDLYAKLDFLRNSVDFFLNVAGYEVIPMLSEGETIFGDTEVTGVLNNSSSPALSSDTV